MTDKEMTGFRGFAEDRMNSHQTYAAVGKARRLRTVMYANTENSYMCNCCENSPLPPMHHRIDENDEQTLGK